MNKPWSTVDDEELKLLRLIATRAVGLERGCYCQYDYRCSACTNIIEVREMAEKIVDKK